MELRLNKAHYPVTVLGYGRRVGIWFQGCSIGCPGCCSQDTWAAKEGDSVQVSQLLSWIESVSAEGLDGVTITGGEPFEQPKALLALLSALLTWRDKSKLQIDFLCYSGFSHERLKRDFPYILALLDVLIPEPFVHKRSTATLRGSDNQTVIPLTTLGASRYQNIDQIKSGKNIQIALDESRIWFIGVPDRGDLERMEVMCREKGLVLNSNSWRA